MLLSYAFESTPDPLRANGKASLTLVVSNSGRQTVSCSAIVVRFPVGTAAKDLIANSDGIETHPPPGWNMTHDGGEFTLAPAAGGGAIGADGLAFIFAAVSVNDQPGTAGIVVDERAAPQGGAAQEDSAVYPIGKFPASFELGELSATPPEVVAPGETTLMWVGSDDPTCAYVLEYEPADDGVRVRQAVGHVGPYQASDLTRSGSVTFYLTATITVPGQDVPLVAPRETTVTVDSLSLDLRVAPPKVPLNGLVRLSWKASNATSCTFGGTSLPVSGEKYYLVQHDCTFDVAAYDDSGNMVEKKVRVAVDPTIIPTGPGHAVTGPAGANGSPGTTTGPTTATFRGGDGQRGGDASLAISLGPLDPVGRSRVIPVTIVGGQGGNGGTGAIYPEWGTQEVGGNGGCGGNAALAITLDPAAEPAQYVIVVRGGGGGAPGEASWSQNYGGPQEGQPGSVSITLNGEPLEAC